MNSDRIEKSIVLKARRSRVWKAIADAEEFGSWFGIKFEGGFAAGRRLKGQITTPGYTHLVFEIDVERIEPETLFSYRWHPYAVEPGVDYSVEPTTLVEFRLAEVAGGTRVDITESGFDSLPAARRDLAFRMDDEGWAEQVESIEKYVAA
ncbi:MAG TPA: SRPBCC family protein [Rectinemataceae bacterium]|nr:SRPBCC family protein [Rectinemataceae bacterium]